MNDDDFVPVDVGGSQDVEVGKLRYTSVVDGKPSSEGYFLCRHETSFGGPYYQVLYFRLNPIACEISGRAFSTHWQHGAKPEVGPTHWAPLPKIPLDAVVPTPQE